MLTRRGFIGSMFASAAFAAATIYAPNTVTAKEAELEPLAPVTRDARSELVAEWEELVEKLPGFSVSKEFYVSFRMRDCPVKTTNPLTDRVEIRNFSQNYYERVTTARLAETL